VRGIAAVIMSRAGKDGQQLDNAGGIIPQHLHALHTYLYWGFRLRVYFCTNRILINPAEISFGVTKWRRVL